MRALFVAMIIAGFSIALGYPWYMRHFTGDEIGRWPILESRQAGFITQEIKLEASDAPVRIFLDATPLPGYVPAERRSAITLAVSRNGFPVLSQGMDFASNSSSINTDRPQDGSILRQSAGDIDPVLSGTYSFRAVQGNTDGLQLSKVDLVLRRGAEEADETYTTIGLILGVLGVYALMRTRIRRRVD
ncbi:MULTISPECIES: type IV secretion system effector BspB [unclassified Ochrobactrum]|uniref:type IV secretion system effector BspB n=1 Tax=unclassified Ochrobactrum TaxID=239106 RepID=UPI00309DB271